MSLNFSQRVLWFGKGDPRPLRELLDRLAGFHVITVSDERSLLDQLHSTRAAIFEFDGDIPSFVARIRRTKENLLANGILIGLMDGSNAEPGTFESVASRAIGEAIISYGPGSSTFTPFQLFWKDFYLAAHRIIIWRPAPDMNETLVIKGNVEPIHTPLFRRAFSDFRSIHVRKLKGGASGSYVYFVIPTEQPRTPFLAKIDYTNRIAAEKDRYDKYVRKYVSFKNRPNLSKSRTIYTHRISLLVEDFLDRFKPISDLLPTSNPVVLIASLFEGALRYCRRGSEVKQAKLADYPHFAKILNRRESTFLAAGEYAKRNFSSPFNGEELLEACSSVGIIDCTWSRIHGDLHANNVYVSAASSDVVLIDFYKCDMGPAVADPACLEVDIVFKRAKSISKALTFGLYNLPVNIPSSHMPVHHDHIWLLDAVRAIRMIGTSGRDRDAYSFALACYLIQYASFADNETERKRGLAVCIASRLIRSLLNA